MIKKYGLVGIKRLIISLIYTKIYFKRSRLIRLPIDIRNKKSIDFGKNLTTGIGCRIEAYPKTKNKITIKFGNNVQLNDYVHITAMDKVLIGNNVLMASKIYISDCSHGFYKGGLNDSSPNTPPIDRKYLIESIEIGNNVWIGESVSILPGVKIGNGAIIGSNSVVTRDIQENTIAVGIPAKPIKKYNFALKIWEEIS